MQTEDYLPPTAHFSAAELYLATVLTHEKLNEPLIETDGPFLTQVNGHHTPTSQRRYYDASNRSMTIQDLENKGMKTQASQKRTMECVDAVFTIRHWSLHTGLDQYVNVVKDLLQERLGTGEGDVQISKMIDGLDKLTQPKDIVGGKAKARPRARASQPNPPKKTAKPRKKK